MSSGVRLWMKRDDLTGLGAGGNKGRKLEYLCGRALDDGADCLVTVGAAQSNHCRMTAAAGARLGLDVHLVLSGTTPERPVGNQLLSTMFGAHLHHTGLADNDWRGLETARAELTAHLEELGRRPHSIPIGGSTAIGALGYVVAHQELMAQCLGEGFVPAAIVHTSSSGGTHAGLVAGMALARGRGLPWSPVIAVAVAKGFAMTADKVMGLARETLALARSSGDMAAGDAHDPASDPPMISRDDIVIESRFLGQDYAVPTAASAAATAWAARRGAWVLDPVYTAKGFAGLLAMDEEGRFAGTAGESHVVFIHTGGLPSVFAAH